MHNLIQWRDGAARVEDDDWVLSTDPALLAPSAGVVLPWALLRDDASLASRFARLGIALAPADDPAAIAPWFDRVQLIAIEFPNFADGRGYSSAALLRGRLGWKGDLRAVGDVLRDQLFYLRRVGFSSFAVRADRSAHDAVLAFADFSDSYQASIEPATPLYRRPYAGVGT